MVRAAGVWARSAGMIYHERAAGLHTGPAP